MSKVFQDVMASLDELIAHSRGESADGVRVHRMAVVQVETFTPDEIRSIRKSAKMTQAIFAACIGVTTKSVEAWEGGRSTPDGAARRTLGMVRNNPQYFDDMKIIIR